MSKHNLIQQDSLKTEALALLGREIYETDETIGKLHSRLNSVDEIGPIKDWELPNLRLAKFLISYLLNDSVEEGGDVD